MKLRVRGGSKNLNDVRTTGENADMVKSAPSVPRKKVVSNKEQQRSMEIIDKTDEVEIKDEESMNPPVVKDSRRDTISPISFKELEQDKNNKVKDDTTEEMEACCTFKMALDSLKEIFDNKELTDDEREELRTMFSNSIEHFIPDFNDMSEDVEGTTWENAVSHLDAASSMIIDLNESGNSIENLDEEISSALFDSINPELVSLFLTNLLNNEDYGFYIDITDEGFAYVTIKKITEMPTGIVSPSGSTEIEMILYDSKEFNKPANCYGIDIPPAKNINNDTKLKAEEYNAIVSDYNSLILSSKANNKKILYIVDKDGNELRNIDNDIIIISSIDDRNMDELSIVSSKYLEELINIKKEYDALPYEDGEESEEDYGDIDEEENKSEEMFRGKVVDDLTMEEAMQEFAEEASSGDDGEPAPELLVNGVKGD